MIKLSIEQQKKAREIGATHWDSEDACFRKCGKRYVRGQWVRGENESGHHLYPYIQPIDFSELDERVKTAGEIRGRFVGGYWKPGLTARHHPKYPKIQPIDFSELDDYQQDKEFDIAATSGEDDQIPEFADMVNHPPHYQGAGVECIDAIRAALGSAGFIAYCRGNALKYEFRADKKGDEAENHKKAAWYIARAIEELENNHA